MEGIENVPAAGGALLVSNHSGALPPDAAMIAKAIREEHPHPRPLNITVEHFFKGYPGFSMLIPKIGCVPAHPANVHRLLYDEEQLVLVFPEGRKGTEKLYKDRYRLRRFGRGGFVEAAMRAQVPIVPVCVVGAEEAAPVFAQLGPAQAAHRASSTSRSRPRSRTSGRSGCSATCPPSSGSASSSRSASTRRASTRTRRSCRRRPTRCARGSRRASGTCSPRASRCGSDERDSRRILVTGLSTYWGGRLAQALEAFDEVEAMIGVDNEEPQVELERTEYVKVGTQHALLRRVVEAAEIDTVVDTRLVVDSATTTPAQGPREQRDRDDEHPRRVQRRGLARAQGRVQVLGPLLRLRAGRPGLLRRDDGPLPPAAHAASSATWWRPRPRSAEFAEKNPDVAVTVLRFANVLGPSVRTSHIGLFSLPAVPMILGFDPRYQFVHEDDVVHALEHAVRRELPGVYNVAGDGVLALSEVAGLLGKPYAPILPPWGTGLAAAALRRLGVRIPPEAHEPAALRPRPRQPPLQGGGLPLPAHEPRDGAEAGRAPAPQPGRARRAASPTATSARSRSSCAGARTCSNARGAQGHALSRDQLVELQRLLVGFEAGVDLEGEAAERERRQALVEEQARLPAARRPRRSARHPGRAPRGGARAGARRTSAARAGTSSRSRSRRRPGRPPVEHYDDLAAEEVIALLGSLEADDLAALREHERDHAAAAGCWPPSTRCWRAPAARSGARKRRCTGIGSAATARRLLHVRHRLPPESL